MRNTFFRMTALIAAACIIGCSTDRPGDRIEFEPWHYYGRREAACEIHRAMNCCDSCGQRSQGEGSLAEPDRPEEVAPAPEQIPMPRPAAEESLPLVRESPVAAQLDRSDETSKRVDQRSLRPTSNTDPDAN